MPPGDIESENLAVHVGACRERYKTLFASLDELRRDVRYIRRIGFSVAVAIIVKLLAVLGALVMLLWQTPAQAQPMVCGDRANVVKALHDLDERRIARGVGSGGELIEVFATEDGATWTLLMTIPGGPTCLLGAGEHWEDLKAEMEPKQNLAPETEKGCAEMTIPRSQIRKLTVLRK